MIELLIFFVAAEADVQKNYVSREMWRSYMYNFSAKFQAFCYIRNRLLDNTPSKTPDVDVIKRMLKSTCIQLP